MATHELDSPQHIPITENAILRWSASKALENIGFRDFENTADKELLFFRIAGRLKEVERAGWKRYGIRHPESVSDHSWRMSLLALCAKVPGVDNGRVSQMAIVHDLAEVAVGDITPHDPIKREEKARRELETMTLFASMLSAEVGKYILDLWLEFEEKKTKESKVANDLDKVDMVLQAVDYEETQDKTLEEFMRAVEKIVVPELRDLCYRALARRDKVKAGEVSGSEKKRMDEYYGDT
ncbi:HD domain-containing protein [Dactylonectria macrodidyma]|uniref:5'-deoxynucleotidase n=1 Tax=Dactylonectria macrodidyma TaxID=307937 RepID=A0A9P9F728_9HYPO|nr:HD domain-containing protein [Dactylonectria macrodidyma]